MVKVPTGRGSRQRTYICYIVPATLPLRALADTPDPIDVYLTCGSLILSLDEMRKLGILLDADDFSVSTDLLPDQSHLRVASLPVAVLTWVRPL